MTCRAVPVGHLDAVFLVERAVKRVRVVGLVADEPGGELVEEASGQNVLHTGEKLLAAADSGYAGAVLVRPTW